VEEFVAPSSDTTAAVNEWLTSNGLKASPISPAGDWLGFSIDVKKANDLLDADFSVFTHQATGKQTIRTLSYSIPAALKGHIELVHPTILYVLQKHSLGIRFDWCSASPATPLVSQSLHPHSRRR
jgi:tripeptidyl-peptidase-1